MVPSIDYEAISRELCWCARTTHPVRACSYARESSDSSRRRRPTRFESLGRQRLQGLATVLVRDAGEPTRPVYTLDFDLRVDRRPNTGPRRRKGRASVAHRPRASGRRHGPPTSVNQLRHDRRRRGRQVWELRSINSCPICRNTAPRSRDLHYIRLHMRSQLLERSEPLCWELREEKRHVIRNGWAVSPGGGTSRDRRCVFCWSRKTIDEVGPEGPELPRMRPALVR